METYELQNMTGDRAKLILEDLLNTLSDIEVEDMTTFELSILHRCASNPPSKKRGVEEKIYE